MQAGPTKAIQNITMLHCYIASKTCHRINSPETGQHPYQRSSGTRDRALPAFQSVNMNATRSFFSWVVSFVPRIRLKNSTESSRVINRPS